MAAATIRTYRASLSGKAGSFGKHASERFPIAIDWQRLLPSDTVLLVATLSAIDLADDSDATATVWVSPTGRIQGSRVEGIVHGGEAGHRYHLVIVVQDATAAVYRQVLMMSVR